MTEAKNYWDISSNQLSWCWLEVPLRGIKCKMGRYMKVPYTWVVLNESRNGFLCVCWLVVRSDTVLTSSLCSSSPAPAITDTGPTSCSMDACRKLSYFFLTANFCHERFSFFAPHVLPFFFVLPPLVSVLPTAVTSIPSDYFVMFRFLCWRLFRSLII